MLRRFPPSPKPIYYLPLVCKSVASISFRPLHMLSVHRRSLLCTHYNATIRAPLCCRDFLVAKRPPPAEQLHCGHNRNKHTQPIYPVRIPPLRLIILLWALPRLQVLEISVDLAVLIVVVVAAGAGTIRACTRTPVARDKPDTRKTRCVVISRYCVKIVDQDETLLLPWWLLAVETTLPG